MEFEFVNDLQETAYKKVFNVLNEYFELNVSKNSEDDIQFFFRTETGYRNVLVDSDGDVVCVEVGENFQGAIVIDFEDLDSRIDDIVNYIL